MSRMTEADVAAIREALGRATPGPWEAIGYPTGSDTAFILAGVPEFCSIFGDLSSADAELMCLLRNHAEALLTAHDEGAA